MSESQVKVNIFRARKYVKEYINKLELMMLWLRSNMGKLLLLKQEYSVW
jgi:hypothetical protein